MKEASGEANMTIVTIIIIGVVVAIATPIVTGTMKSSKDRACCTSNGGEWTGGKCSIEGLDCSSFESTGTATTTTTGG